MSPSSFSEETLSPPKCAICTGYSQGVHFGVLSCAACTAFFRRAVRHNRNYLCAREGQCLENEDSLVFLKCRSCKFNRCLQAGMDKTAVQCNRDVIGRRSLSLTQEKQKETVNDADLAKGNLLKIASLSKLQRISVLDSVKKSYDMMNRRRAVLYNSGSPGSNLKATLKHKELDNFAEAIFSLHQVEPELCLLFINENSYLASLPKTERRKIFGHFASHLQGIEGPYMSWAYGTDNGDRVWVMPNKIYLNLKHMEHYFDSNIEIVQALNLDKTTALRIHEVTFINAMDMIDTYITRVAPTEDEVIFLLGLIIYDPGMKNVNHETKNILQKTRNLLIKEFLTVHRNDSIDPVIRLDEILWIFSGVKEYTSQLRRDMLMFRFFDILPPNEYFDEIWSVDMCDIC